MRGEDEVPDAVVVAFAAERAFDGEESAVEGASTVTTFYLMFKSDYKTKNGETVSKIVRQETINN